MYNPKLRYRQIHLDFHLSEHIPSVGDQFDPDDYAETLKKACVNSVTTFARCHHGWMYYDSKAFPERIHPNLVNRNLLSQQIEACHKRDIRVPIYTSVQWDDYTVKQHPEWRIIQSDGKMLGGGPLEPHFYKFLCVNTPYRDFLKAHLKEVLETLPSDGFFIDIIGTNDCSCQYCMAGMDKAGIDPSTWENRMKYARSMMKEFKQDMTAFIRQYSSDCMIFYNAGHIGPYVRESQSEYTHFELESVPSGGWGYIHFPMTMRYARNLGPDCLGQTGKFHQIWGDVHSFKNKAALDYEAFRVLALNGKCSIGDQLHPSGKICRHTYSLIGSVFSEVEKKEPWCEDAKAVNDIGVFTAEEFEMFATSLGIGGGIPTDASSVVRILERGGHQFDIVDTISDWESYPMLILPDYIQANEEFASRLDRYVERGGKLIASFASGMNAERTQYLMKSLGVKRTETTPLPIRKQGLRSGGLTVEDYSDFLLARGDLGKGLYPTEYVMYLPSAEIEAEEGCEVLADTIASYFDRTWRHFCSHQQTPSSHQVKQPAVVRNGNAIYFAHPLFTIYRNNAPNWCKTLLLNAVDILLPNPVLRHNGPTTLLTLVNEQSAKNRWVVHLLHYIPERRCSDLDIIEDVIPLYDIDISLRPERPVQSVHAVPQMQEIDFSSRNGRVEFTLSKLTGHQMIEIAF